MVNLTLIICILISLAIAYFVMLKPLFLERSRSYFSGSSKEVQFDESYSLLEAISELETDYRMGKLSKDDFETTSLEYKRIYLEKKRI
ncbi:hypothetical protein KJ966_09050 [bacterium]|nr:hypothetical protein [bacterium]